MRGATLAGLRIVTSAYGRGAEWEKEFFAEMVASWKPMLDALGARLGATTTADR